MRTRRVISQTSVLVTNCQSRRKDKDTSKKPRAMSPSSRRSRFFVKVVADHTASSMPGPTNQRTGCCSPVAPSTAAHCECCRSLSAARPQQLLRRNRRPTELHVRCAEAPGVPRLPPLIGTRGPWRCIVERIQTGATDAED